MYNAYCFGMSDAAKGVHVLYFQALEGIPAPYDKTRRVIMPSAYKQIKLKPNRKFAPVGRLAAETGWKQSLKKNYSFWLVGLNKSMTHIL